MLWKLKLCGAYWVDFTVDGVTVHTLTFYEAFDIVYLLKHAWISYEQYMYKANILQKAPFLHECSLVLDY